MIDTVASHPSVIQYELFNENDMVSDFNVSDVVEYVRQYGEPFMIRCGFHSCFAAPF